MTRKDKFSSAAKAVVHHAFRLAGELGHSFVGSEHILWSLARGAGRFADASQGNKEQFGGSAAAKILDRFGLEHELVRELIEKYDGVSPMDQRRQVNVSPDANRIFQLAEAQADKLNHAQVVPEHLLLGILQEPTSVAAKIILSTGANPDGMTTELLELLGTEWPVAADSGGDQAQGGTKNLDEYSRDLTVLAQEGKLDPVIGRAEEIQRVVQILSRRTKNNPVLIGEPGVGKTALAEGLAQRIVSGDIPETLLNKRVLSLDLTKMLSGTKYRGDFEERIKNVIEEAAAADNVLLFIDELHTLIGTGAAEGAMDAANILKPALSRGEIQVVGATTLNEYRKHIEKDSALERRFQPIIVEEPSPEDSVAILYGLRARYEAHHKLTITDEAIEAAVTMSSRYIQDRYLPDKAIDLVDEAASRVRTHNLTAPPHLKELEAQIDAMNSEKESAISGQNYELAAHIRDRQSALRGELEARRISWSGSRADRVTAEDIAAVVSAWTGIPVTMLGEEESQRLLRLEDTLHQRVIGQDEAVTAVSKAIRRGRVGLKDPGRPMGAFLFLGPTGVGKTELCKALAETMFQDEDAMIRVDMSEMMERHTVSKLIGSPPGYVGYDEGGQLTEKVRRKPYSVILFDEIEKAHEDVFNILLQIMEDGRLTDAQGRKVDFKHAIIVMTSNLGAKDITDARKPLGFINGATAKGDTRPLTEIRKAVMEEVKKAFKPEFLNRVDDVIVFHQLTGEHIRFIAEIMLANLRLRMADLGLELAVEDSAMALLAEQGFDPAYGARPLRRVIQSSIEDAVAEKMLEAAFQPGTCMKVSAQDGSILVESIAAPQAVKKELSSVH